MPQAKKHNLPGIELQSEPYSAFPWKAACRWCGWVYAYLHEDTAKRGIKRHAARCQKGKR